MWVKNTNQKITQQHWCDIDKENRCSHQKQWCIYACNLMWCDWFAALSPHNSEFWSVIQLFMKHRVRFLKRKMHQPARTQFNCNIIISTHLPYFMSNTCLFASSILLSHFHCFSQHWLEPNKPVVRQMKCKCPFCPFLFVCVFVLTTMNSVKQMCLRVCM